MIKSVGQTISSAVDAARLRETGKGRGPVSVGNAVSAEKANANSTVARMAAEGAPVDMDRIAQIKAAIASGNYPVNPQQIAEKMIALDLPAAG